LNANSLYWPVMKSLRCLLAALLLLAFGGGTAMAMGQGDDMMQHAVQTSADQSMPSDCSKCGGDMSLAATTCSVLGTCMPGVIVLSERAMPQVGSIAYPHRTEHVSGLQGSPEPFPPRCNILA
jgi:hypothetical protein